MQKYTINVDTLILMVSIDVKGKRDERVLIDSDSLGWNRMSISLSPGLFEISFQVKFDGRQQGLLMAIDDVTLTSQDCLTSSTTAIGVCYPSAKSL